MILKRPRVGPTFSALGPPAIKRRAGPGFTGLAVDKAMVRRRAGDCGHLHCRSTGVQGWRKASPGWRCVEEGASGVLRGLTGRDQARGGGVCVASQPLF